MNGSRRAPGLAVAGAIALILAGGVAGASVAKPRKPAVAAPADWTKRVTATPDGAFVLGNPAARVRLVEYISYTCSHCAHYAGASAQPLKAGYIAGGKAAVELRHAVRDPFDLTAALLARCGGASRFFGNTEAILAAQPQWLAKAEALDRSTLPTQMNDGIRALAKQTGLDALMRGRGFTAAQIDACLTDKAQQELLGTMTQASFAKISGTPSFELNGAMLDGVHDWASLEPRLRAAIAR